MRDEAQAMWRDGCSIFSERSRRLARGGLEYTVGVQSAAFQGLSVTGVEFPCRSGSCSACWKSQGAARVRVIPPAPYILTMIISFVLGEVIWVHDSLITSVPARTSTWPSEEPVQGFAGSVLPER